MLYTVESVMMILSSLLRRRNELSIRMDYFSHSLQSTLYRRFKQLQRTSSTAIGVMHTFDAEEDYEGSPFPCYYDSYNYIDSGVLHDLVNGFYEKGITATFYVTPNVAKQRPEELNYLEKRRQRVGVHLHVHNLLHKVRYPYHPSEEDKITSYDFRSKLRLLKKAKALVETALGHEVILFRSGGLACDSQVERAAKLVGFKAISNHTEVFPIRSLKLWNLGAGTCDLFSDQGAELDKYVRLFKTRKAYRMGIVFSAHPMLLHDKSSGVRKDLLEAYFKFLNFLQSKRKAEVTEQHELLSYLTNYELQHNIQ